jgi:signal transduction histidine kinase/CheY-like chemotaxis protein
MGVEAGQRPARTEHDKSARRSVSIALFFAAVGTLWLLASDQLVAWWLAGDLGRMTQAPSIKGFGFVFATGFLRDLTGQRAMEAQLRQSQKLEAVGQLTGGVAHDFNNLLTVIIGNAELLEETTAPGDRVHRLARLIRSAGERGAGLTHRLLVFARRQDLQPVRTDINQRLSDMQELLHRALGEQVEIALLLESSVGAVLVDPSEFENAMLNFALNARDAMPLGGRLTIETAGRHVDGDSLAGADGIEPGDYVLVRISDNGAGMPKEVLARVFEPFFTTKEVGKGTGLGLSMVYGFVKQSGGQIRLYSEPGRGTVVSVYLPRYQESDAAQPPVATAPVEIVGGSERILLVEDEELVRRHAETTLSSLGYGVVSAANGHEALQKLDELWPFDLLLTDVVMPGGMTGPQLAEIASLQRPSLRLLFISGCAENALRDGGGIDITGRLLSKPFRRAELAQKLRAVLDERS